MIRKIIKIDDEKCNGCALCADACHEGAIGMNNDKAILLRDDYCDGLGDCLPVCPTNAISFEEREALEYNETEVLKNMEKPTFSNTLKNSAVSRLNQWPVQIKLAPVNASYFNEAELLIAADCAAYAHGDFHESFMAGKVTLIGCPKLDNEDYAQKLTAILQHNNIKTATVVRMQLPCCSGLEYALVRAHQNCGKIIPWEVITLAINGKIVDE